MEAIKNLVSKIYETSSPSTKGKFTYDLTAAQNRLGKLKGTPFYLAAKNGSTIKDTADEEVGEICEMINSSFFGDTKKNSYDLEVAFLKQKYPSLTTGELTQLIFEFAGEAQGELGYKFSCNFLAGIIGKYLQMKTNVFADITKTENEIAQNMPITPQQEYERLVAAWVEWFFNTLQQYQNKGRVNGGIGVTGISVCGSNGVWRVERCKFLIFAQALQCFIGYSIDSAEKRLIYVRCEKVTRWQAAKKASEAAVMADIVSRAESGEVFTERDIRAHLRVAARKVYSAIRIDQQEAISRYGEHCAYYLLAKFKAQIHITPTDEQIHKVLVFFSNRLISS